MGILCQGPALPEDAPLRRHPKDPNAKDRSEKRRTERSKGLKKQEIWLDYYAYDLLRRCVEEAGFAWIGERIDGISAVLTQAIMRYAGIWDHRVMEEKKGSKLEMLKVVRAADAQHRLDQGESMDDIKKDWNKLPSKKNPFREPDDKRNWTTVGLNRLIRSYGPKGRKPLIPKPATKAGKAQRSIKKK